MSNRIASFFKACFGTALRRRTTLVVALSLFCFLTIGASVRAWFAPDVTNVPTPLAAARSVPAAEEMTGEPQSEVGPVQVIRFRLYDVGVLPRRSHAQAGLVALQIEDLSGGSTGLVVERVNGNGPARALAGHVRRYERHWRGRDVLRLQPGTYVVSMADRPGNRAELIVAP